MTPDATVRPTPGSQGARDGLSLGKPNSHGHILWRGMLSLPILLGVSTTLAGAQPLFQDRAPSLPVAHSYTGGWDHFVGGGVAIFDCNGDDRADLFAAGGTSAATLLINDTAPGGAIIFTQGPLPEMLAVTGAYPIDMDGDAIVDLMVLRNGPNIALRGTGDCTFEEATDTWSIAPGDAWSTAFSATWEAGQGRPTFAIGNYVDADDPDGPFGTCDTNRLFRPGAYDAPVALEPAFCPLSMLFNDWRRDGRAMLRISNDRHYYLHDGREQMWSLNPLRELTEEDGWQGPKLWGMGIASQDLTGDGLPEVMLTSMGDQLLMLNDGAGFTSAPFAMGTAAQRPHVGDDGRPSTGWHAEFADVDNDGRADLFIAKGNVDQMPGMAMADPNNLLMQQPDGTFAEAAADAGIATTERARGGGLADLNGDGRLDLVVVNRRAPLEVWENVSADTGNWIAIDPRQDVGNRYAVGAFVEVRSPSGLQVQERTIGGGHVSGSLLPLHFGLGQAQTAEVRITWPDGVQGPWRPLDPGVAHRIQRP